MAADVISFGGKEQTPIQQTQVTDAIGTEEQAHKDETPAQTTPAAPQPIPVGATMYVGNCNVSVTLRSAPATSSSELCQIPLAEEIYVVEYTNDEFARVRYNGTEGYVKRAYIVSVRPQVYSYDSQEAAQLVHNAVVAFVDGVNSNSDAYVSAYYSGSAADEERKSVKSIAEKVISEEIISLNCHSVTRVSATQVSVIRDSVIRVLYNDNTVKDITERYKYTVDISGTSYKIVGLSKA